MKKNCSLILLGLILLLGTWLRFRDLHLPREMYFDEVYHVPTIDLIAHDDPRAFEWWHQELTTEYGTGTYVDWLHPPLAKLIQAFSLKAFGLHPWSWRAPSALAGVLLILVVYSLARELWGPQSWASLIAALLASIDGLALTMSRIAMNDIFLTLWCALAVFFFWRWWRANRETDWWLWTLGASFALASKWTGIFLWGFFGTWLLIDHRFSPAFHRRASQKWWQLVTSVLVAVLVYLFAYLPLFHYHDWSHFLELHEQILSYQLGLDATHPFASPAWMWPWGFKSVLWYADDNAGIQIWERPFYFSWYFCLGCLFVSFFWLSSRQLGKERPQFTYLLLAYFWLWAPWLFSPRILFLHHYLPALPFLWVLSGRVFEKICCSTDKV
ncbi:glycosyltransferase family 39 protein [bacterium]|nr:glycosyltransferase family 39 protein [bacterium]